MMPHGVSGGFAELPGSKIRFAGTKTKVVKYVRKEGAL